MDIKNRIEPFIRIFTKEWFENRNKVFKQHPCYDRERNLLVESGTHWVDADGGYPETHEFTSSLQDFYWYPDVSVDFQTPEIARPLVTDSGSTKFYSIGNIISQGVEVVLKNEGRLKNSILDAISEIRSSKDVGFEHPFQNERDKLIETGISYLERRFEKELMFTRVPESNVETSIKFRKSQTTIIRLLLLMEKSGYFADDFNRVKHYASSYFRCEDSEGEFPTLNFDKFRGEISKMNKDQEYARFFKEIVSELEASINKLTT